MNSDPKLISHACFSIRKWRRKHRITLRRLKMRAGKVLRRLKEQGFKFKVSGKWSLMLLHEHGLSSYGSGRKATPREHEQNIRKFTWLLRAIVLGPRLTRDVNIICYGRFSLRRRFNVDQVPFSWDLIGHRSWQLREEANISSCGSGARQRLGTLHVC